MKNTQFKVEDVVGVDLNEDCPSSEQRTKLKNS